MPKRLLLAACVIVILQPAAGLGASDTRLADAAERGDLAAVRSLIEQRVDVNAKGVDGTTALHRAAHADHLDIAEMLLGAGADATAGDRYGVTPLYLACVNGNAKMIQRLLDAGADRECGRSGGRDGADGGRPHRRPFGARVCSSIAARAWTRETRSSNRPR